MTDLKYWLEKVSFSVIDRFVIFFFGFSSYFLMVRDLNKTDFGIYTLFTVIVNFVEVVRVSFIQNGFVKNYVDAKNDKGEVLLASLTLNILLTAFSTIILFIAAGYIGTLYESDQLGEMLSIYCIASVLLIPYTQLSYFLAATLNFKTIALLSTVRYGSFFLMVLTVFFFFPEISPISYAKLFVLSIAIGSTISLVLSKKMDLRVRKVNFSMVGRLFHFGKYTFGVGITSLLTRSVDQLMIGVFMTAETVASYNVAGRFLNFIEIPIASISNVIYPKFADTANETDPIAKRAQLFEKSTGSILACITPFAMLIFFLPSFFITIVAGEKYLDAVPILQILIAYNLIKPFATQSGSVLEVSGKPHVGFYSLLITTLINIILNYLMIPLEGAFGGMMGAAMATVISGLFYLTVVMIFVYKECRYSLFNSFKAFFEAYQIGFELMKKQIISRSYE